MAKSVEKIKERGLTEERNGGNEERNKETARLQGTVCCVLHQDWTSDGTVDEIFTGSSARKIITLRIC